MKRMISDRKCFRCSCQKKFISSSNLQKHLNLPFKHKINPIPTSNTSKNSKNKVLENQSLLRYSIENLFLENHKKIMMIFSQISKQCLNLGILMNHHFKTLVYKFLKPLSIILTENLSRKLSASNKILNDIQKLPIKEITDFKKLKSNFKSAFQGFLKKSTSYIQLIVISPDEKYLVSGNQGTIKLWDPLHLVLIKNLCFHTNWITCIDIESSSEYMLCGSFDRKISLWSLKSMRLIKCFAGHLRDVITVKFFNSSKQFLSGSNDNTLRIWDTFRDKLIWKLELDFNFFYFFTLKNSMKEIVGGSNYKIYKLNIKHKKVILSSQKKSFSTCAIMIENERKIVLGYNSGMLEKLYFDSFNLLDSIQAHSDAINSVESIQIRKILVTCSNDCIIKLWDEFSLCLLQTLTSHVFRTVCVKFALNRLYSSGYDGNIFYYNSTMSNVQNVIKTKPYFAFSFAISINLILIAFGIERLNLYCLKNEIEIGSVTFKHFIKCLNFHKSIIACGTLGGEIYLVDSIH